MFEQQATTKIKGEAEDGVFFCQWNRLYSANKFYLFVWNLKPKMLLPQIKRTDRRWQKVMRKWGWKRLDNKRVLHRYLGAREIERSLARTEGDWFHFSITPDQMPAKKRPSERGIALEWTIMRLLRRFWLLGTRNVKSQMRGQNIRI